MADRLDWNDPEREGQAATHRSKGYNGQRNRKVIRQRTFALNVVTKNCQITVMYVYIYKHGGASLQDAVVIAYK